MRDPTVKIVYNGVSFIVVEVWPQSSSFIVDAFSGCLGLFFGPSEFLHSGFTPVVVNFCFKISTFGFVLHGIHCYTSVPNLRKAPGYFVCTSIIGVPLMMSIATSSTVYAVLLSLSLLGLGSAPSLKNYANVITCGHRARSRVRTVFASTVSTKKLRKF